MSNLFNKVIKHIKLYYPVQDKTLQISHVMNESGVIVVKVK